GRHADRRNRERPVHPVPTRAWRHAPADASVRGPDRVGADPNHLPGLSRDVAPGRRGHAYAPATDEAVPGDKAGRSDLNRGEGFRRQDTSRINTPGAALSLQF